MLSNYEISVNNTRLSLSEFSLKWKLNIEDPLDPSVRGGGGGKLIAPYPTNSNLGLMDASYNDNKGWQDFKFNDHNNVLNGLAKITERCIENCNKYFVFDFLINSALWTEQIDKPLCDFAPNSHEFTPEIIQQSWNGTQEYIYAPIAYDWHLNVADDYYRHTFPFITFRPSYFLLPIIERMFYGWRLEGSFLKCISNLVMPYTFGKFQQSDEVYQTTKESSCVVNDGTSPSATPGNENFFFDWVFDSGTNFWENYNDGNNDILSYKAPKSANYCVYFKFTFDGDAIVKLIQWLNGETVSQDSVYLFQNDNGDWEFEGQIDNYLLENDLISFYLLYEDSINLIDGKITVERKNELCLGDTIYPSSFFPKNKTGLDLVKALKHAFNLNIETDYSQRCITIESRNGGCFGQKELDAFYREMNTDYSDKVNYNAKVSLKNINEGKQKCFLGWCEDSGDHFLNEQKQSNGRQPFEGGFEFSERFEAGTEHKLNELFAPTLVSRIEYNLTNQSNPLYPTGNFNSSAMLPVLTSGTDEIEINEGLCDSFKCRLMWYAGISQNETITVTQSDFNNVPNPNDIQVLSGIPILQFVDNLNLGTPSLSFSGENGVFSKFHLQEAIDKERGHQASFQMNLNRSEISCINERDCFKLQLKCDSTPSSYQPQCFSFDNNTVNVVAMQKTYICKNDLQKLCESVGSSVVNIAANNFVPET